MGAIEKAINHCCEALGCDKERVMMVWSRPSNRDRKEILRARQCALFVCYSVAKKEGFNQKLVASIFGVNRTTISHTRRKFAKDENFRNTILWLQSNLNNESI